MVGRGLGVNEVVERALVVEGAADDGINGRVFQDEKTYKYYPRCISLCQA